MTAYTRMLVGAAPLLALVSTSSAQTVAPRYGSFGIDLSARKASVRPGDDFWTYANGGWADRAEIPAASEAIGVSPRMSEAAQANVHQILDDAARSAPFDLVSRKIGALYASWMDEVEIEARGTGPLSPYLGRIAGVTDLAGLQKLFATSGYASPVALGIQADLADPTRYVAVAAQGDLGMPRDYYLMKGEIFDASRRAYRAYVHRVQELAGIDDAGAKANAIVALETAMARQQWSFADRRDITKMNDPESVAGLKAKAPEFDWVLLLKAAGLTSAPNVVMNENTAISAMGKLLVSTPLQTWKNYLAFRFVSDHAEYLPKAFDDAHFGFYAKTLYGVQRQRERWKRGVELVNGALGEAVGQKYVARYYPPAAERQMAELIENLRSAYRERIKNAGWMDATTKRGALLKLAALEPRIRHPDVYIDYSSLRVERNDLLGNVIRSTEFASQLDLQRFPKPVDRTLWVMTPQTTNGYYDPSSNQIFFPAAILQPPFFNPKADAAVNYGAIGAFIGHEMGHAFDDQGSQFGPAGQQQNWWSDTVLKAFKARTDALSAQYSSFEALPGMRVNGALTLGENIADLGGVEAAYAAYQKYQARYGTAKVIAGLTGDQRFFLAYAQTRQTKIRTDTLRQLLLVDTHSPSRFRANGVVRNVDGWYKAFDVRPSDALYLPPDKRVHIW